METVEPLILAGAEGLGERPVAAKTGTLYGVGMGPGDPDYLTVRAVRVLERAPVLVHFCKKGRRGNARTIADAVLDVLHTDLPERRTERMLELVDLVSRKDEKN